MTLLVGILCKDGVVMASDSAATFASGRMQTIGQQSVKKVVRINDHILYAGTGAVGIAQLITDKLKALWDGKVIKGTPENAMNVIGMAINGLVRPYLETAVMQQKVIGDAGQSVCKSMVAIPVDKKPCLFTFDVNGSPERATADLPFVALGSGQAIADPFLAYVRRVLWKNAEPTLAEGRLVAAWTIDHVARTNPGGVGGDIQLSCLVSKGGDLPMVDVSPLEGIQEHLQRITSAEQALIDELRGVKPEKGVELPVPPAAAAVPAQAPVVPPPAEMLAPAAKPAPDLH